MRKYVLALVALFGLIGVSAVANADEPPDLNHAWFFGDCEGGGGGGGGGVVAATGVSEGCRGFGIFFGHFDAQSLADAIAAEAWDELYAHVVVVKWYGFKVGGGGTQFVQPIFGTAGDTESCSESVVSEDITGPDITGGLWIAWFEVEVCGYLP